MAEPGASWWQSFGPFVETAVGSLGALGGRLLWTSFFSARNDELKEDKEDERARRKLLRTIDSRAEVELDRSWKRIDELNVENVRLRADCRLWEMRCRRADTGWHELRTQVIDERRSGSTTPIPPIPKIEDPV
jgi:hypothetical protein